MRAEENIDTGGGYDFPIIFTNGGISPTPIYPISTQTTIIPIIPMSTTSPSVPCNCLAGTPVINNDGSCGCTQPTNDNGNVIQPPVANFDLIQTLKDHPHAALIGGVIALYLLLRK